MPSTEVRNWVIYKITSPSGRIYIGKSCNFTARKRQYKCLQFKNQNLISKSLAKYGFNNHSFDIIEEFCNTADYCSGKEIFWIRSYMSNKNRFPDMNGLNLTDGGEGALGIIWSEESKEKARKRNLGRKLSDEQKINIGKALKGRKGKSGHKITFTDSGLLGKKEAAKRRSLNIEWVKAVGESNRKRLSRPVVLFDNMGNIIKEYPSLVAVAAENNITKDTVRSIIRGARPNKVNRHLIIKYKDECH